MVPDESAAPSLSPSTLRGYRDALAHLAPIADIPLGQLQPEDIERALADMTTRQAHAKKQERAAPKTVRNVQVFLRRALGQAEQRGHTAGTSRSWSRCAVSPGTTSTRFITITPISRRLLYCRA